MIRSDLLVLGKEGKPFEFLPVPVFLKCVPILSSNPIMFSCYYPKQKLLILLELPIVLLSYKGSQCVELREEMQVFGEKGDGYRREAQIRGKKEGYSLFM